MRPRRALATAAVLVVALLAPVSRAEEAPALQPGARGVALTALQGDRIEEIPLTYLGLQPDFVGPGYDLHLVQLEGPVAEQVGVAAGMSGSPVYIDGTLIGALSYRLGTLPRVPVAGVTPIADVLRAARAPARAGPDDSALASPIVTPVHVGGLNGAVRAWAAPQLSELGFVPVSGGRAAADGSDPAALRPGSPVGVELVRGDLAIAATGTVTWVDGARVYAFGHPFLGSGPVEMPMVSAAVVHTLADLAGSVKLASVGSELGAIYQDRLTAIVGETGRKARMIPLRLAVRGASYDDQRFRFEIARSPTLSPLLAAVAVANALSNNAGYDQEATMLVQGTVRIEGHPDLPVEMASAGFAGNDPAIGVAVMLQQTLGSLWLNPFADVDLRDVELDVTVRPAATRYVVDSVNFDRLPLRPGQTLRLSCVLRKFRGTTVTHELELKVPDDLPRGQALALAVGAPEEMDRLMGQPFLRRLRSAPDLSSVIRVLGERRSPHRLNAVLFQRKPGTISRGAVYADLPPTAERLLTAPLRSPARTATRIADLARAELELDGPIEGSFVVRVLVDSDLDVPEELGDE